MLLRRGVSEGKTREHARELGAVALPDLRGAGSARGAQESGRSDQSPAQATDHRSRHVERPLRGDTHGGCGGRVGETGWSQGQYRAPARPDPAANEG